MTAKDRLIANLGNYVNTFKDVFGTVDALEEFVRAVCGEVMDAHLRGYEHNARRNAEPIELLSPLDESAMRRGIRNTESNHLHDADGYRNIPMPTSALPFVDEIRYVPKEVWDALSKVKSPSCGPCAAIICIDRDKKGPCEMFHEDEPAPLSPQAGEECTLPVRETDTDKASELRFYYGNTNQNIVGWCVYNGEIAMRHRTDPGSNPYRILIPVPASSCHEPGEPFDDLYEHAGLYRRPNEGIREPFVDIYGEANWSTGGVAKDNNGRRWILRPRRVDQEPGSSCIAPTTIAWATERRFVFTGEKYDGGKPGTIVLRKGKISCVDKYDAEWIGCPILRIDEQKPWTPTKEIIDKALKEKP